MMQFDLFDQGAASQPGSRQTDLEMLIAEKAPMNSYELKQEAKRDRLEAAADRAEARSDAAYGRADLREGASGIPLGQPILVGHHSEGRHRAAINRADNAMRKSIAESKRAGELRAKAAAVGTGGISSDDPEAVQKLQRKIDAAQASQDKMKAANKIVKRVAKKGNVTSFDSDEFFAYRLELAEACGAGVANNAWQLLQPDFCGRIGFASYQLTNNNANIKRMQKRINELRKAGEREAVEVEKDGYKVIQNTDENRLQFIFDGKPSAEARQVMKSNGFRWAPSQEAWQRQLTNSAIWSGKMAMKELEALA